MNKKVKRFASGRLHVASYVFLPPATRHLKRQQRELGLLAQLLLSEWAATTNAAEAEVLPPVEGQHNVWQTAGYESATNQLDLTIHVQVGSVTID